MSFLPPVRPIDADDATIRAAVADAPIGPLLPAMAQLTGDLGLLRDDLVTHLNGQPIVNAQEALNRVAAMEPGSTLDIRAVRGAERLNLRATLQERPPRGERQPDG